MLLHLACAGVVFVFGVGIMTLIMTLMPPSLFVTSGRTEYQATHGSRLRRTSTFERRPSKRYPSRRHSTFKGGQLWAASSSGAIFPQDEILGCFFLLFFSYKINGFVSSRLPLLKGGAFRAG